MKSKKEKLVENAKKKQITEAIVDADMHNKVGFLIIGLALLILVCCGIYFASQNNSNVDKETDGEKFALEYEKLNCEENDEDCSYMDVTIDSDNPIKYSNYEEIFELLEDGTGVIYFGFPECPWCRNLVPILMEAADEVGIEKIYYLNNVEDRDKVEMEDDEFKTTKEGSDNYYKLLDEIKEFASDYTLTIDDEEVATGKKRLYFPTVLSIKDGEIVGFHEATLDSQENPFIGLTKEQKEELKGMLVEDILKTVVCSDDGKC